MERKKEAARRSCNYGPRQCVHSHRDTRILSDDEYGRALTPGCVAFALSFGAMFLAGGWLGW